MDWLRVQTYVKRRRAELGISQRRAADLAVISPTTWGVVETHGEAVADGTAAAMSKALGWTPGSIKAIAGGGEPTAADRAAGTLRERALAVMRTEAHDVVDRLDWSEVYSLILAAFWLRERSAHMEPRSQEEGQWEALRRYSPSLDNLLWDPPPLDDAEDIIHTLWGAARHQLDEELQRHAQGLVDAGYLDAEDYAYAADDASATPPGEPGSTTRRSGRKGEEPEAT